MPTLKERQISEDSATLKDGLRLTTSRALIARTSRIVQTALGVLSIIMPLSLAVFYTLFILGGAKSGFRFIANCIMLPLILAELIINVTALFRKKEKNRLFEEAHEKKIIHYLKLALSAAVNIFAVCEALMHPSTAVQILVTSFVLSTLFIRILFEVLRLVLQKYIDTLFLALAIDLKRVVNRSTLRGAVSVAGVANAIKNPESTLIGGFNKLFDKLEGGEKSDTPPDREPEPMFFEQYIDRAQGDERTKQRLTALAAEFRAREVEEEKAEEAKRKAEKAVEWRKLRERAKGFFSRRDK